MIYQYIHLYNTAESCIHAISKSMGTKPEAAHVATPMYLSIQGQQRSLSTAVHALVQVIPSCSCPTVRSYQVPFRICPPLLGIAIGPQQRPCAKRVQKQRNVLSTCHSGSVQARASFGAPQTEANAVSVDASAASSLQA